MGRGVSEAVPAGRLFVAGKDHFSTGNRQQAMARIATGNYDAVIVSHRSFEFLPVSDEYFNRFVEKQVAELDNRNRPREGIQGRQPPHREGTGKAKKRLGSGSRNARTASRKTGP
jgi:N12 class adenine-specific DNA methylase